jgi:signal transduction histidine kinase
MTAVRDQLMITGITFAACLVVGGLAFLTLRLLRRASIRYQLIIAGLTPLVAVGATVVMNVRLMFLSSHDSGVMMLALSVSLVLAAGLALLITRRIAVAASQLGAGISRLGPDDQRSGIAADPHLPAELAEVMSELESTRSRLVAATARERAAQQARQQLVQHLSHDLRTPLSGLRAMAEALEDDMIADVPLAMRQIRATVGRMDALVGDLFDLSRLQAGRPERQHRPVSIRELIIDLAEEAESAARREGVALLVEVPEDDRLAISGDVDDLARAVGNLIANAVRHTAAGGTVALSAGRGVNGTVRVAVTDGCGGIPTADLSKVFDAGWRGDQSRTAPDRAGLGLAIVRGVVESHQGHVTAHNVPGGCCFEIELGAPAGVSSVVAGPAATVL